MNEETGSPRYRQLADILMRRIADGTHALGGFLPTEAALAAEFAVSRHTVREALRQLAERGLVTRRQGSGTQVVSTVPRSGFTQSLGSLSELFEFATDTRFVIARTALVRPAPALARFLGRGEGAAWLLAEGVRQTRDGTPISVTRVYLHEDFAGLAPELPGLHGPFYQLIEQRHGRRVAEVVQEITAEPFGPAEARAAGVLPGSVAVRVVRHYLESDGAPLQVSMNWHPAADFRYRMRIRRDERA
jgi:DNA-binding GntR family transcriptional regulator